MRTAYTRSDRVTGWAVLGIIAVAFAMFLMGAGCTAEQQAQFQKDHPKITAAADQTATVTAAASKDPLIIAGASTVPWGGAVLAAIGAIATFYMGHRNGVSTTTKAAMGLTGTGKID